MSDPIRFGTDGIRGIAGEYPLAPATVLAIGRAVGGWLRSRTPRPTVLIGRDTRPSGPHIAHALTAGLTAEGVTVDDIGVITTPGVAYLTRAFGYELGIVISASHNPAEQNGIKLIGPDVFKLSEADEADVEATIIATLDGAHLPAAGFAPTRRADQLRERYLNHLLAGYAPDALRGLTVVLDCANGAAYALGPAAFARLGAAVTALGASPTGDNINVRSGSEYVRRHRADLLAAIQAGSADLGIAFDGDADRVVFLTPAGTLIDGDHTLALLAGHLHRQGRLAGATVVATTMSNSGLEHYLRQQGIRLERTRVGDRYVLARMREHGYTLGGEQAGHVILLDGEHTTGDGLHIGLLVASLVAQEKEVLDRIAAEAPRQSQVIASAHLSHHVPLEQIAGLQTLIAETLLTFDGRGRVDVRYSGTEPNLLRVMVEGGAQTAQAEVIAHALKICRLVAEAGATPQPRIDLVDCATGDKIGV
jgi:phosphoglucosamine mutase